MASEIAAIYRASKKKQDINWFTEYIARPPAAVVVYALRNTPITPNQVTFLSARDRGRRVRDVRAAARLDCGSSSPRRVFEFSFVLDCADGQLARLRKIASPLGHLLDFLMDELKAMLLFGCVAVRLWRDTGDDAHAARRARRRCSASPSGIALTSFMRRPEYGGEAADRGRPARRGRQARAARSAWCSRRSSGRRASSCTTRSTSGSARSRTASTSTSGRTRRVNALYLAQTFADDLLPAREVRD